MVELEGRPDFPLLEHFFDLGARKYFSLAEGESVDGLMRASAALLRRPVIVDLAKAEAANKHFHNIDYKTELKSKLQRTDTLVHGLLIKVEFFADVAKTERVLTVDRVYDLDPTFGLVSKHTTRTYYCHDGFAHEEVKETGPYYYTTAENMAGVARYRENIINEIKAQMMNALPAISASSANFDELYADGNSLMADLYPSISRYIASGSFQGVVDYVNSTEGQAAHPVLMVQLNEQMTVAGFIQYSLENA